MHTLLPSLFFPPGEPSSSSVVVDWTLTFGPRQLCTLPLLGVYLVNPNRVLFWH